MRAFSVSRAAPASPVAGVVGRVLVGEGPRGSQARIEFRTGPLAGAAIHLATGQAGIEVQLVAAGHDARDALARVVDRAEARLKAKGISMRAGTDSGRADARGQGPGGDGSNGQRRR
jgi:hypothetical protein